MTKRKISKTKKSTPKEKKIVKVYDGKKFTCNKCLKDLAIDSNYYKVKTTTLCAFTILPICKKCLFDEYERLRFEEGDKTALKIILRKMDKPYLTEVVKRAFEKEEGSNVLGSCIKILNGLNQYAELTYDDSDFIKSKVLREGEDGYFRSEVDESFDEEDKARWSGYGLLPNEMLSCKKFYDTILELYEIVGLNEKISVEQLAISNINLKKAFKDNDANAVERLRRTISSIESDLNIQAKQKSQNLKRETFGSFIRMIENEEPIPKAEKEFEDVDGIWEIVRKYIVGYLPVAMGKAREQEVLEEDADILDEY